MSDQAHDGTGIPLLRDAPVNRRARGRLREFLGAAGYPLILTSFLFVWPFTQGSGSGGSFLQIGFCLIVGLALIFGYGKTHLGGPHYSSALIVSIPIIAYFLISATAAALSGHVDLTLWVLFGAAYFAVVAIRDPEQVDVENGYTWVAYAATLVYLVFNLEGIIGYGGGRGRVSFDNGAYTLSAYAIAAAFVCAAYALLTSRPRAPIHLTMLLVSAACIVSSGTRSVYIGLGLTLIAFVAIAFAQKRIGALVRFILIGAVAIGLLSTLPFVAGRFATVVDLMVRGSGQILGVDNVLELSAEGRYLNRNLALETIGEYPFFGAGFRSRALDFPLLQAFQDLGIFFGILFFIAFLVTPLAICAVVIARRQYHSMLFCLIYICNVPRLFLHGQPYDWVIFTYLVPVYGVFFSRSFLRQGTKDQGQ